MQRRQLISSSCTCSGLWAVMREEKEMMKATTWTRDKVNFALISLSVVWEMFSTFCTESGCDLSNSCMPK